MLSIMQETALFVHLYFNPVVRFLTDLEHKFEFKEFSGMESCPTIIDLAQRNQVERLPLGKAHRVGFVSIVHSVS